MPVWRVVWGTTSDSNPAARAFAAKALLIFFTGSALNSTMCRWPNRFQRRRCAKSDGGTVIGRLSLFRLSLARPAAVEHALFEIYPGHADGGAERGRANDAFATGGVESRQKKLGDVLP